MSEAQHQAEADQHEENAAAAEARYDPSATTTKLECNHGKGTHHCWTSSTNPTDAWLELAERERAAAAAHRAASTALAEAEDQACVGLDPDDRDISPFEHTDDITSVTPHTAPLRGGSTADGVVVTFRALPGLTTEWLQHAVDCHLARAASLGHEMPEMPDCPLVPKGAQAKVESTTTGFAITVWSDDPASASEIAARAARLVH